MNLGTIEEEAKDPNGIYSSMMDADTMTTGIDYKTMYFDALNRIDGLEEDIKYHVYCEKLATVWAMGLEQAFSDLDTWLEGKMRVDWGDNIAEKSALLRAFNKIAELKSKYND